MGLIFFIILSSVIFALLEIQIEGENGWAEKLPTWKIKNPLVKLINWPYLTGYHLYYWLFLLIIFQLPFFVGTSFNIKNEILISEILLLILILEDFMWFLLNPKWGIKKFLKEEIPWHPKKFFFLPRNYWISLFFLSLVEIIRKSI